MPIENKKEWNNLLAKARHGDPEAQWEVEYCYEECVFDEFGASIVKAQPSRALHWYTLSAKQGHTGSQIDFQEKNHAGKT